MFTLSGAYQSLLESSLLVTVVENCFAIFYRRYKEMIQHYDVDYVAGGATQNSIRVAQVLNRYNIVTFCANHSTICKPKFESPR